MSDDILTKITSSIIDGNIDVVVELTQQAIEASLEPMLIIDQGLMPGITTVGDKFASGEFFLPNLIIAGAAMQKAMTLLEPELRARQQKREIVGKVVLGTVKGDVHEIGKSLVATMLSANGFEVTDLGVDVPTDTFVTNVKEIGADILGLSALLTTTMTVQQEVITALEEEGIRNQVLVIVGGAPISQSWAEKIGADGYADDAIGAVQVAQNLLRNRRRA